MSDLGQTFSIRRRVLAVAVLLLTLATIVLVVFLRDYAQGAANRAFDRLLAASALTVAGSVHIEDNQAIAELPFAALAMLSSNERVFYVVRDAQGQMVTGYDDLDRGLPLADSATATFQDTTYLHEGIRMATLGRLVSAGGKTGWVTIRVAETRGARDALATEILNRSVMPLFVLIVVALALLWFGVNHAFAPLRLIGQELRQREPSNLQPLRSPVPSEVRRLVVALNAFMARLQTIMNALNNLVADAAHQVRTPLASLRAQAEVALDETDPDRLQGRLRRIHSNATLASELVNQLLMDATITHRLGMRAQTPVSVVEILNDTRRRIAPDDVARLVMRIEPDVRRARVQGDRIALREMLRNLVDNALRYAPASDVYVVAERLPGARLSLTISDRGPGLADNEKDLVLERFHRASTAEGHPGSGLGMAIVAGVVAGHEGRLSLRDTPGGGLTVNVDLPLLASTSEQSRISGGHFLCTIGLAGVLLGLGVSQSWATNGSHIAAASDVVATVQFPARSDGAPVLIVAGPTDAPLFEPLARGFQQSHPNVALEYREIGSRELYQQAVSGNLADVDVLISSAVDMQMRLANDGYALAYQSVHTQRLPSWAVWRSEVFGFTFEPVVLVYNPQRFTEETVPRSRRELLELLENDAATLKQRIGTYDIAASSVGHLLATLDEQVSSNFWGLMNAFGQVGVQLEVSTGAILDQIESGDLDLGYNVLGSYAISRQRAGAHIGIAIPEDYVLVLARAALISRTTQHPALSGQFIDWLLSPDGQRVASQQAGLGAIMPPETGSDHSGPPLFSGMRHGTVQPVALRPVLLAGLDQQRKSRFLKNWIRLVTDTPDR